MDGQGEAAERTEVDALRERIATLEKALEEAADSMQATAEHITLFSVGWHAERLTENAQEARAAMKEPK